jgi:hypothetical protein
VSGTPRVVIGATLLVATGIGLSTGGVFSADPDRVPTARATGTPTKCDRSATTETFAAQVAAAAPGQAICLATGDYGTFAGTDKAITLRAADGAKPRMTVEFDTGDAGFTLDGIGGLGGSILGAARRITIRDSTFTAPLSLDSTGLRGILLDGNSHDWKARFDGGANAKLYIGTKGTLAKPAVTVRNSTIRNGDLDGIHVAGASGLVIENNEIAELCDIGTNHTDAIQFGRASPRATQVRISHNYVHASRSCTTQGIDGFDAGTGSVIIEDNVVDVRRPWNIELYADSDSIVRHNTVRWHSDRECSLRGPCGQIDINRKREDPAGTGTQVIDNIVTAVGFSGGSTGVAHHNMCRARCRGTGSLSRRTPIFAGGANPTTWAGHCLAARSPGKGAASDGLDIGIRC